MIRRIRARGRVKIWKSFKKLSFFSVLVHYTLLVSCLSYFLNYVSLNSFLHPARKLLIFLHKLLSKCFLISSFLKSSLVCLLCFVEVSPELFIKMSKSYINSRIILLSNLAFNDMLVYYILVFNTLCIFKPN